jgi:hypothetical protein
VNEILEKKLLNNENGEAILKKLQREGWLPPKERKFIIRTLTRYLFSDHARYVKLIFCSARKEELYLKIFKIFSFHLVMKFFCCLDFLQQPKECHYRDEGRAGQIIHLCLPQIRI